MKHITLFIIVSFVFFSGCVSNVTKKTVSSPYNASYVSDPALYSTVFQEVYEQLAYYMEWNLDKISTNEIAVILEIEVSSDYGSASDKLNGPIVNGWTIIEYDSIELTPKQILSLSTGIVDADIRNLPTAKFFVDYEESECKVYAYYWLLEYFGYSHEYTFKKNLAGEWKLKNNKITKKLL